MKKKLLLIVSMLAVTFMFAGCSASDDNGVKFAYNDQEIAQVAKDACETYQKYASADETYNYVIEAGEDAGVSENEIEAVKSFRNIGQLQSHLLPQGTLPPSDRPYPHLYDS